MIITTHLAGYLIDAVCPHSIPAIEAPTIVSFDGRHTNASYQLLALYALDNVSGTTKEYREQFRQTLAQLPNREQQVMELRYG